MYPLNKYSYYFLPMILACTAVLGRSCALKLCTFKLIVGKHVYSKV